MLDCTKIKTFTPIIPAGTGPTFTNAHEALLDMIHDMNESSGGTFSFDEENKVAAFMNHVLSVSDWIDGTYPIFPDYELEVKTMQKWQFDQMPEFDGY
ncbi:hypothetical protein G3578_09890 [Brevibacillus sp. SYP-B805]|uniref:hypothetical protein n=1 Tax=Brevibacillus sp. SYP-B805 TaxID=1578199 RepID=UPI0013EA0790|nr:hypothetical protein [Brevibacillus sp. SYP-B805]NGQ95464.1 hypothetical protein [Brevibacillus sp. SYP-B805]